MKAKSDLLIIAIIFNLSPLIYGQCLEICDANGNTALARKSLYARPNRVRSALGGSIYAV